MSEPLDMPAIVDATIDQILDLSARLSALVAKDNELRAAGAEGKLSPATLSKVYNLLAAPLQDQIGKATPQAIMPQGLRVPSDPKEAERWALENIQALQYEIRQRIEPYVAIYQNIRNSRPAPFNAWWEKPKG